MKIKSNLRAGSGGTTSGGASGGGQNSKSINNTVVSYTYIPAISRCVGI
jgi:hypothetical protein